MLLVFHCVAREQCEGDRVLISFEALWFCSSRFLLLLCCLNSKDLKAIGKSMGARSKPILEVSSF